MVHTRLKMISHRAIYVPIVIILVIVGAAMLILGRPTPEQKNESRIILKLEASTAVINLPVVPSIERPGVIANIIYLVEENLSTSVKLLETLDDQITIEIGCNTSREVLADIIGTRGTIVELNLDTVSENTRDEVINILSTRAANLHGAENASIIVLESNLIEVIGLSSEKVAELLNYQGQFEAYIENTLVLASDDIERVGSINISNEWGGTYKYEVPLRLSQGGADKFAAASQDKADYPFTMYLDRPENAVLLFNKQLLKTLPDNLTYDNSARMFHVTTTAPYGYHLLVTSFPIDNENLSEAEQQTLQEMRTVKSRTILLGENAHYSENVVVALKSIFSENNVEFFPQTAKDDNVTIWINRACGLQSAPAISVDIAGKAARDVVISGSRSSYENVEEEANHLRGVLPQRLPVKVSVEPQTDNTRQIVASISCIVIISLLAALFYLRRALGW